MPDDVDDPAVLVRAVAEHQRAGLLARSAQLRDDQRTVTGLSWGVAALDRVIRACDGETDPGQLGLPGAVVAVEQDGLFG